MFACRRFEENDKLMHLRPRALPHLKRTRTEQTHTRAHTCSQVAEARSKLHEMRAERDHAALAAQGKAGQRRTSTFMDSGKAMIGKGGLGFFRSVLHSSIEFVEPKGRRSSQRFGTPPKGSGRNARGGLLADPGDRERRLLAEARTVWRFDFVAEGRDTGVLGAELEQHRADRADREAKRAARAAALAKRCRSRKATPGGSGGGSSGLGAAEADIGGSSGGGDDDEGHLSDEEKEAGKAVSGHAPTLETAMSGGTLVLGPLGQATLTIIEPLIAGAARAGTGAATGHAGLGGLGVRAAGAASAAAASAATSATGTTTTSGFSSAGGGRIVGVARGVPPPEAPALSTLAAAGPLGATVTRGARTSLVSGGAQGSGLMQTLRVSKASRCVLARLPSSNKHL